MIRRRRFDVVLLLVGAAALLASALLARQGTYRWEEVVFGVFNDLPDWLQPYLWSLNQYGTAITIPVVALAALVFRRWRMAAALSVSGASVYLLAKVMKGWVERGRPAALFESVETREIFAPGSLAYPSGHAAVAAALTVIVAAYLSKPWVIAAVALAVIVPLCRMYVGAHLPLDLTGGAGMGVAAAAAVNLILGVPATARVPHAVPP